MIKFGSDFSGIGAADQALMSLGIEYKTVFACDMDKYARQSFIANYGEPDYYPENVYDREIPKEPLDLYVPSPPCQAFSIAGKRGGKDDKRGILFFNSHEFIKENKPRFFIFENVKGLLSHDKPKKSKGRFGHTFDEWIQMLGGKSVNEKTVMFPHEDSVPYHIYWKVLNATDFNVPQNRERVFIVGIRDDQDNNFEWPKDIPLILKVADILEENVPDNYYLSEKAISRLLRKESFVPKLNPDIDGTINTKNNSPQLSMDNGTTLISKIDNFGNINPSGNGMNGNVYGSEGIYPTLSTNKGEGLKFVISDSGKGRKREEREILPPLRSHEGCGHDNYIVGVVRSDVGFRAMNDNISPSVLSNTTTNQPHIMQLPRGKNTGGLHEVCPTISSNSWEQNNLLVEKEVRQLNPSTESGGVQPYQQNRIYDSETVVPALCKDKADLLIMVNSGVTKGYEVAEPGDCISIDFPESKTRKGRVQKGKSQTIDTGGRIGYYDGVSIRRLTPRECMRLMDFPDGFIDTNNFVKNTNNKEICLYLDKKILWKNVNQKTAKENQKPLDIVLCTIKDSKNTGIQNTFSNIPIEEMKNVVSEIAIKKFTQLDFAYLTTTQTENTEILYSLNIKELKIKKEQTKEFLSQMENIDSELKEFQHTELFLKVTLDENLMKVSVFTILTAIHTIMKSIIYTYSGQKVTTLKVMLNYKKSLEKSHQNSYEMESFILKMESTKAVSDSMLYKQAGNSIVVACLKGIISKLKL